MGWGMSMGIGWPNASAYSTPPVPTSVYYQIDNWCLGEEYPGGYTTQLVDPNIYHTGDYVFSTDLGAGVLLGAPQSTPESQFAIVGPSYPYCPPPLESYTIYDCIEGQYYITGPYEQGWFGKGNRVYTDYGNYGYVYQIEQAQEGNTDTEAFPIGYVDNRCNDCNVTFSFQLGGGEGENDYNILLFATESLGEVNFQSSINPLFINLQYVIEFVDEETGSPVYRYGNVQFQINEYIVGADSENIYLGEEYAFNLSGGPYNISNTRFAVTEISVNPTAFDPYDTGWVVPNRYVTNYGNVWTFYYP